MHKDPLIAQAAARVVAHLAKTGGPKTWTQLYSEYRYWYLKPKDVSRIARLPKDLVVHPLGVASLNGNGYVREAAVRQLFKVVHEPDALPYVLLRLADWVPRVRGLAEAAVDALLAQQGLGSILDHTDLIDWMVRVQRVDLSGIRRRIIDALRAEKGRTQLLRGLDSRDHSVALFCCRALEDELLASKELTAKVACSPALLVRLWFVRKLARAAPQKRSEWLPRLLEEKSSLIRLHAMYAIDEDVWRLVEAQVAERIFDDSPGIRHAARFRLSLHGLKDFAPRYRERIEQATEIRPGVISGLAETGDDRDTELIGKYVADARPRIRAAALGGLFRLQGAAVVPLAFAALGDPSGRVRRVAREALKKNLTGALRQRLRGELQSGLGPRRLEALRILRTRNDWQALCDVLLALSLDDLALCEEARAWLDRFDFIRLWGRPSPLEAEDLRRSLQRVRHMAVLEARRIEMLDWVISEK